MREHHEVQRIALITTGGTIDKIYPTGRGVPGAPELIIGPPVAPVYLRDRIHNRKLPVHIWHRELMRKDSLYMTSADRSAIVRECHFMQPDRIIITHGTDTMHATAAALHAAGLHFDHTIILTGALQPASMKVSDAATNLNLAFRAVRKLPPGIYIAMGELFPWDECEKSESGKFVRIPRRRRRL